MTVTPIRLGPTQLNVTNTSESSLCSPPAGTGVIIKHIQATNNDAAATHYLCISVGADIAANRIVDQVAIAANGEYARFVAHVLKNADILCASADAASKVTLTIRADVLTAP